MAIWIKEVERKLQTLMEINEKLAGALEKMLEVRAVLDAIPDHMLIDVLEVYDSYLDSFPRCSSSHTPAALNKVTTEKK